MELSRRAFLAIGALLALSGCGGSNKEDKKKEKKDEEPETEPEPIVTETTYYDVFRCDWKEGILGDVVVYTIDNMDFSDSYAVLQPDGTFSFEINGVPYNGTISLGKKTHHLYSGQDSEVTQLLFDGKDDTTVGSVLIQGYYVDEYPLIEMTTGVEGKQVFATFYLWKHIDE